MNNHYIYNKVYWLILLCLSFFRVNAQEYEWHITRFTEEDGFSQSLVTKILQDSTGYIWLASWDGLLRYDGYRFRAYKAHPGDNQPLSSNRIDNIECAPDGGLYCRSGGRFYHFLDGVFTTMPDSVRIREYGFHPDRRVRMQVESLPHYKNRNTRILYVDNQGGIWVMSGRRLERIYRRRKAVETYVYDKRGNQEEAVRTLYEDAEGRLWMADKQGHVRIASSGSFEDVCYLTDEGELSAVPVSFGYNVYSILQDRKGYIWMGCKPGGVFRLMPDGDRFRVRHFIHSPSDSYSLSNDEVYSLAETSDGRIWIGTNEGGLNLFEEDSSGNTRFIHSGNELANYPETAVSVRSLYALPSGVLLAGTADGLCICRDSSNPYPEKLYFDLFQREPDNSCSLSNNWITDMMVAADSTLYIATYGGGINSMAIRELLHGRLHFTCYSVRDGLPSDIVLALAEDGDGNIWCTSEMALACFNPRTKTSTNYMRRFFGEGFSFSESTLLGLKDSSLIAGTIRGVLPFRPVEMRRSDFVPNLVFDCPEEIFLKPDEKNYTVRFAALDFNRNEPIRYAYRLDGVNKESEWIYTSDNYVNYSNILPGTSVLHVRSTNGDGNWVDNGRTLTIHRTPHFNERPVAWMLYGALVALVAGAFVSIARYIQKLKSELDNIRLSTGETIEYLTAKLQETLSKGQGSRALEIPKVEISESDDELYRKKVERFVERNIGNPELTINDFASEIGVCRSGLYLLMKRLYGCAPNNYLQQVRLEMAKKMMDGGNANVSEVAYRCGFSDPKYFSRVFKKAVGMTPTEYMHTQADS